MFLCNSQAHIVRLSERGEIVYVIISREKADYYDFNGFSRRGKKARIFMRSVFDDVPTDFRYFTQVIPRPNIICMCTSV